MKTKINILLFFLLMSSYNINAQIKSQIQITQKEITIQKDAGFDRIIQSSDFTTNEEGSPELPITLKSFVIPMDAENVKLNIQNVSKQKMDGQYMIYPAQPPIPVNEITDKLTFIEPNQKIYESATPFPGKSGEIVSDYFYMGYRIVTVQLYPFEYIPKTKELYRCDIHFSIDYTLAKKLNTKDFSTQSQTLYRYELNKKAVKFRVENPEAVDNYDTKIKNIVQGKSFIYNSLSSNENIGLRSQSISVLDEVIPDYIIITSNTLKSAFQPLADWKTKKGIFTIIATTDEINSTYSGSDLAEKIRTYLIEANEKWGSGLYVLLGGDINIIPSRMVKGDDNKMLLYPTDRYYSSLANWTMTNGTFNGNRDLSMINILGRIPVSNSQEVNTYINKVISYEKANNI